MLAAKLFARLGWFCGTVFAVSSCLPFGDESASPSEPSTTTTLAEAQVSETERQVHERCDMSSEGVIGDRSVACLAALQNYRISDDGSFAGDLWGNASTDCTTKEPVQAIMRRHPTVKPHQALNIAFWVFYEQNVAAVEVYGHAFWEGMMSCADQTAVDRIDLLYNLVYDNTTQPSNMRYVFTDPKTRFCAHDRLWNDMPETEYRSRAAEQMSLYWLDKILKKNTGTLNIADLSYGGQVFAAHEICSNNGLRPQETQQ